MLSSMEIATVDLTMDGTNEGNPDGRDVSTVGRTADGQIYDDT
jgi:hypothetical protein